MPGIVTGDVQGANGASSSRHSKPSAASLALKAKRALCSAETSCGASVSLVVNGSGVGVAVLVGVLVLVLVGSGDAVGAGVGAAGGAGAGGSGAAPALGAGCGAACTAGALTSIDDAVRQLLVSELS